ncbi:MAG TPA: response regulator [Myxococcota bacterium]|nr:response regulator [Myxococcota bacterium]
MASLEVLIVEDDRALARVLARALEQAGYSCRQAHDGNAALSEVAKATPDLMLVDLLLPKRDGQAVMSTLQAAEATRRIPIIAMSGVFRGVDALRSVLAAGGKAFLEKPIESHTLIDQVSKLIGKPTPPELATPSDAVDLAKEPAIEALWSAMRAKTTGAVHFETGKRKKIVVLENGMPLAVRSNLARESLGRRLLDAGRIDELTFNESIRRSKVTGKRQGELLVELGAITELVLRDTLADQSADKLTEIFSWTEGRTWTQTGVRAVSLSSELLGWTPRLTVLRGVHRVSPSIIAKRLEPYQACEVSTEVLALEDGENADAVKVLYESVRETRSLGSLLKEHASTLYGLWLIGALAVRVDDSATPRTLPGVGSTGAIRALEGKLRETLAKHKTQNHFEALGVAEDAPGDEVRKAFMALAKTFHPDKVGRRSAELIELAGKVFARISEAHDVLASPEKRQLYVSQLKRTRGAQGDTRQEVTRILTAEQQFQRAEEAMRRRDWVASLEALKWALDLDPNEGEFFALRGWVLFLQQQDQGLRNAEPALEQIKKAIALSPQSPSIYYYLGQIRKACGDHTEAEKMFRKTIELRPDHVEANRELRLIQMRRAKGDDTGGGRLFGRKKK